MTATLRRFALPPRALLADANILQAYHIEGASWIWCADWGAEECGVVKFSLAFHLDASVKTCLHVTADQRFELSLDGESFARGPDRSDPAHWSFSSFEVELSAGDHVLEVDVSWWGDKAPVAQMKVAPGFLLSVEGLEDLLNTGKGDWRACRCEGVQLLPALEKVYHVVGPGFSIEAKKFFDYSKPAPLASRKPVEDNPHGLVKPGHRLHPSPLPEQMSVFCALPTPVAAERGSGEVEWSKGSEFTELVQAFGESQVVCIPAKTEVAFLFCLDTYYCGYSELEVSGGAGATCSYEWAESMVNEPFAASVDKGHREVWEGKFFRGFGDRYLLDGEPRRLRSLWWRSGRFIRLVIKTDDQPLEIRQAGFQETRYPFTEGEWTVSTEIESFNEGMPILRRGLEMCAHENYVDCPFFEQLSYVGDARLQVLTWLSMSDDDRLTKRTLELYDWSRRFNGLVAERYPSDPFQASTTYAMIWVIMVRDFAWWRDEPDFIKQRLPGVRAMIDEVLQLRGPDGLLGRLPGWSFMDWVKEWYEGYAPGSREDGSVCIDLFWVLTLQSAAELETVYGEPECATRYQRLADEHSGLVRKTYWNPEKQIFQDDRGGEHSSIHAQCLAVLSGVAERDKAALLHRALNTEGLARPSFYFDFYLFDALYQEGMMAPLVGPMERFGRFREIGLSTPPEQSDPTRSDCHAWSGHPLYHARASLLGVRPAAPGFSVVQIAPLTPWEGKRDGRIPHPRGAIEVFLQCDGERLVEGWAQLPPETPGIFSWQGTTYELSAGSRTDLFALVSSNT